MLKSDLSLLTFSRRDDNSTRTEGGEKRIISCVARKGAALARMTWWSVMASSSCSSSPIAQSAWHHVYNKTRRDERCEAALRRWTCKNKGGSWGHVAGHGFCRRRYQIIIQPPSTSTRAWHPSQPRHDGWSCWTRTHLMGIAPELPVLHSAALLTVRAPRAVI